MPIDRLLTYAGEDVQNPDQQFSLETNILDIQLPGDGRDRVVRWAGEVFTAGELKSQVELWLGGVGGSRWARSNIALYAADWAPTSGAFFVPGDGPRRIEVRLRSYDKGAEAAARDFRLDALDVEELLVFKWATQGQGDDAETLLAGESASLLRLEPDSFEDFNARLVGSLEVNPIGTGTTWVQIFGDGHLLKAVPIAGPPDLYQSVSPMLQSLTLAGTRDWELRVETEAGCRVRRPFLAMCDWDEVCG